MIENLLHPRLIENKDWATLVFVVAFALIALTKSLFENRFSEFSKLIFSSKYLKVYKDSGQSLSWFNVILFFVQLISLSFLIQIIASNQGILAKNDGITYIRIVTFLGVFILSKYLIDKIIAAVFNIEEFSEQFNMQKLSYRTYISVMALPIIVFLYYNTTIPTSFLFLFLLLILLINSITYLKSLKNYQNLIFGKLFYFILYLCALEIAPFYFLYYWFTKS
jgi:hypothetical protein